MASVQVVADPLPLTTLAILPGMTEQEIEEIQAYAACLDWWQDHPVDFIMQVFGLHPDPWQCDVLDAVMAEDNVAIRACHGVGKTALLAWAIIWFTVTRPFPRLPTTAPTYNKQVRDILWAEIHHWWRVGQHRVPKVTGSFELGKTRLQHVEHAEDWFAVGISSSQPINMEGYHSPHLLAVFDEAKGIGRTTWEAVQGMRTTQEAKLLVASTPGGKLGEFFHVFTKYRETWKSLFVIHPRELQGRLQRKEAPSFSRGGTYYSDRVRPEWIRDRALEWGTDSPVFIARCIGDFPDVAGDVLIPYMYLAAAEDMDEGAPGPVWVACDTARHGRDRTVALVGRGGTILHCESIAKNPNESTLAPEIASHGVGDDPKRPNYRAVTVTAELCRRLRRQYGADGIIIDEGGIGGGVVDILRKQGEVIRPINFGGTPTDTPKTPDERESRRRRGLLDTSIFRDIKAQMGKAVRDAFETGSIALGAVDPLTGQAALLRPILDTLVAQASMMKTDTDTKGRMYLVDPDEQAEPAFAGIEEGKRSPDHFHALMLLWWATGGIYKGVPKPQAGAGPADRIPPGIERIGVLTGARPGAAQAPRGGAVGGQAKYVKNWYR